jgi:hypothetical protein
MAGKSLYKNLARGMELKEIDFSAWGGLENFLMATSTGAGGTAKPSLLRRVVPWIAKACDMTATRVATLPFDILDESDAVYDCSATWKNKLGGMPAPTHIIALIAESLCMGKAYVIPTVMRNTLLNLQYCAPHTVVPLITTQGLSYFPRTSDWGQGGIYAPAGIGAETGDAYDTTTAIPVDSNEQYTANGAPVRITGGIFKGEMMYFWLPDSDIEIGPAKNYPMATALMATGILSKANLSIDLLADHGFIPPTLLAVSGTITQPERERAENFWNDFMRGFSKLRAKILNTEKMDIKQVGAGMAELGSGAYKDISNEQKETIGAAFGIPAAIFMSDMAFASEVNPLVRQWLENGIFVKIQNTIESTFNSQLLNRFGLRLKFKPEQLKAFQEDESKRAAAYRMYVSAGMRPSIVAPMLGIDLPEDVEPEALDEMYNKELENKDKPVAPLGNAIQPPQDRPEQGKGAQAQPEQAPMNADMAKDLSLWKDISLRNFRKGKGRAVDFECKALPESIACHIREKLSEAKTELDIVKAFDLDQTMPTVKSEAALVLEGIRLEIAGLKAQKAQKAG